jgi:folate-binding protein YgfZ
MDDVELRDISDEWGQFAFEGPKAREFLETILSSAAPSQLGMATSVIWEGQPFWWIRKDELSESGFEIILPTAILRKFEETIVGKGVAFGLRGVGPEASEILRLERGIPLYGVDFTEKNNPVEVRLENAYSLNKGCYVGQEVVSKATYVGGVPKVLSRLRLDGQAVPERGDAVTSGDGKEIGIITSAVFSPSNGCTIALAYLRKGFWTPGHVHRVGELRAEVVDSFRKKGPWGLGAGI